MLAKSQYDDVNKLIGNVVVLYETPHKTRSACGSAVNAALHRCLCRGSTSQSRELRVPVLRRLHSVNVTKRNYSPDDQHRPEKINLALNFTGSARLFNHAAVIFTLGLAISNILMI